MYKRQVYQLFPDRFYDALDGARIKRKRRAGPDIVVHRDKREMPFVTPNGDGPDGIENNDFYGGNITGIRSKLAQLCALGVTAIYLNPIFEAASNHRYDTANYERVDRMLGSNEDFIALCREARRKGVRIILDGVFSHTGADSVYFNKFGHYDSVGAYQSESSPYASWYRFERFPDKYETWWGIQSLPDVYKRQDVHRPRLVGIEPEINRLRPFAPLDQKLDLRVGSALLHQLPIPQRAVGPAAGA